jgi:hypothetical protein
MTESQVVRELRTIRTLLAIDKEDELSDIFGDLDEISKAILAEFSSTEWRGAGEFKSDIVEEQDSSDRTVERRVDSLLERNLIEKKGNGPGTEYRLTGLYDVGRLVLDN